MFDLAFLHVVREHELERIVARLRPGARVLEVGGGTGYQARRLREAGFDLESIDVAESNYQDLEFPVTRYDGRHFPFPDASFDIVFSSNVLEHVPDLHQTHAEARRVLRPGGYCVHVMPTGAWRFWTNLAHYVELVQQLALHLPQAMPRGIGGRDLNAAARGMLQLLRLVKRYAIVPRHGEFGNAATEIVTFGRRRWIRHFDAEGFHVRDASPMELFYTGHMVLGQRLSIRARERLARVLGSACVLYEVMPKPAAGVAPSERP